MRLRHDLFYLSPKTGEREHIFLGTEDYTPYTEEIKDILREKRVPVKNIIYTNVYPRYIERGEAYVYTHKKVMRSREY